MQEEDLSKDHETIVESLKKKTQTLLSQQRTAQDYLADIESSLETWLAQKEGQSLNVLENVDEEDQEMCVQELILIDRSISKLVLLLEKNDLLIEKNDRLLNKAILKIKSEALISFCDNILKELDQQNKQSVKIEEKLKTHHSALQKKVESLQERQTSTINVSYSDLEDS